MSNHIHLQQHVHPKEDFHGLLVCYMLYISNKTVTLTLEKASLGVPDKIGRPHCGLAGTFLIW